MRDRQLATPNSEAHERVEQFTRRMIHVRKWIIRHRWDYRDFQLQIDWNAFPQQQARFEIQSMEPFGRSNWNGCLQWERIKLAPIDLMTYKLLTETNWGDSFRYDERPKAPPAHLGSWHSLCHEPLWKDSELQAIQGVILLSAMVKVYAGKCRIRFIWAQTCPALKYTRFIRFAVGKDEMVPLWHWFFGSTTIMVRKLFWMRPTLREKFAKISRKCVPLDIFLGLHVEVH